MLRSLLILLSWIYRMITSVRNFLYNNNLLRSHEFDVPVISVGNITVGGTGKTPHTEYIVNVLKDKYSVTVLSRGYKRKTKGFVAATEHSTVAEIGDEPKQMLRKFNGEANVCVCESRVDGIEKIVATNRSDNQVVVLDDAYQHRSVNPLVNILLIDYNRPIFSDSILPYGRLRESAHNSNRANIILVTKCPEDLKPIDRNVFAKNVNKLPFQSIYFTNFKYKKLTPVFREGMSNVLADGQTEVLIITGIANPDTLLEHVRENISEKITHLQFPDHHNFSKKDIKKIIATFMSLGEKKIIITTEKDSVRLIEIDWNDDIKASMYFLPIEVNFIYEDSQEFNNQILKYVAEDRTNYRLHTTVRQF